MIDDLTPLLQDLSEPVPPSSITATVMARIARDVDQRAEATATARVSRQADRAAGFWTFAGLALVLVATIKGWLSSGTLPDFTSSRIGLGRVVLMPVEGSLALLLALGLVMYLGGLFSPLRTRTRD